METQAEERPYQRAVVFPHSRDPNDRIAWTQLSFDQLNRLTDAYARGLTRLGVVPGDRVSLLVRPSLEFIPLVFAVFKVGGVPVLIDPGMGRKPFLRCLEKISPRVLIAVPLVQALRGLFRSAFASVELSVTAGPSTGWWGGVTLKDLEQHESSTFSSIPTQSDDLAAILFTSGSTGPAKGVVYTHSVFNAQTQFIRDMYSIEPGEIDLACFPLFGLFSMALGMTVVIPELNPTKPAQANPRKLVQAIIDHGCTSAFGSPAIWKNVAEHCLQAHIKLRSLRRILMAGAPVPPQLHEAFSHILNSDAQVHTPFGATEALPVATIGSHEVLADTANLTRKGDGTCVGYSAPDMLIRIIRTSDEVLERWEDVEELTPGDIGEICVRGPVVTPRYEAEPEQTAGAKIIETDPDGHEHVVHRMGDLGYLDTRGRLWFCGRKRHRVELKDSLTLYPVLCEAIFDEQPDVFKTALVGTSKGAAIIIQLKPNPTRSKSEVQENLQRLGQAHEHTQHIHHFLFHHRLPVDVRHNAKIDREALAKWAEEQLQ